MIILGEDYGEGASVIQERSYAYAMKSSMWLLDPRPDLPTIVRMVEKGFELSEASHAPVMLELRVRACHVTGEFTAKNNRASAQSGLNRIDGPPRFNYARLAHPPLTFAQEKLKIDERLPAAQAFAREHKLNEFFDGDLKDIGIIVLGGLTNTRAARARAARPRRRFRQCAHPDLLPQPRLSADPRRGEALLRRQARRADRRGRLPGLHRAGGQRRAAPRRHPDAHPRQGRAAQGRRIHRRSHAARARELPRRRKPAGIDAAEIAAKADRLLGHKTAADRGASATSRRARRTSAPAARSGRCSPRSSSRSARSARRTSRPTSAATRSRPSRRSRMGNSILGYGMSLASAAAVAPNLTRRPISVMGDGGFWHNGLITGVAVEPVQQERRRADRDAERLHVGDRPAIHAVERDQPAGRGARHGHRARRCARSASNGCARCAPTASPRWSKTLKEAMRTAGRGPQGHHRGRRMPVGAPAPRARRGCREAQGRRARGAHQVRRRRRDLHRRSFLHPPLRLSVAHREAEPRSAAHRSGREP